MTNDEFVNDESTDNQQFVIQQLRQNCFMLV